MVPVLPAIHTRVVAPPIIAPGPYAGAVARQMYGMPAIVQPMVVPKIISSPIIVKNPYVGMQA
jgi:hypothetical protein